MSTRFNDVRITATFREGGISLALTEMRDLPIKLKLATPARQQTLPRKFAYDVIDDGLLGAAA